MFEHHPVVKQQLSPNPTRKWLIIHFFFPMYPLRVFRSLPLMMVLALLLALGMVLSGISIPIGFGIDLGFAYMPVMVAGWFFGPVIGTFFGVICDTLSWLVHGWIWYWLYAIDEPIAGLIAGLLSGFLLLSQRFQSRLWIDVLVNQLLILGFLAVSLAVVYTYTSPHSTYYQQMVKNYFINPTTNRSIQILVGVFLAIFTIVTETLIFWQILRKKRQRGKLFLYASIDCVLDTALFAFILGPIAAIGYYQYVNGHLPQNLTHYGYMFYLLPRIVTECLQTPIYILLYTAVLYIVQPLIKRNLDQLQHRWI